MTLEECYKEMGADLQEVLRRLKTEERIGKFLKLILTDTNYESLCKELEEKARLIANRTLMEALQGITVEELSVSQEVLRKIFFNTKD